MYNKLNRELRKITVEKRLTYSFFLIALISILIVGGCTVRMNKSTNYSVQLVDAIGANLKNELSNYEALLNELMVNRIIQKGFREYDTTTYVEKANYKNEIDKIIIPKLSSYPYIRDIKVINLEEEVVYQHGYLLNDQSHIQTMTQVIEEIGGQVQCFMQPIYGENYIILSKVIHSTYDQKKVGYMIMVLKEDAIKKIYEHINFGEGANIYLVDKRQRVLSSQFENLQLLDEEMMGKIEQSKQSREIYFTYNKGYEKFLVISQIIKTYGINFVVTIPYEYLLKEIMQIIGQVISIIIVCFILSICISKVICKSITEPLKKLQGYISSSMEEKFEMILIDESSDELGVLSRNYVQITEEMHQMIKTIEKNEKERLNLEINMLQAQINPHFLFNTLNSLRWISMMSGAESVSQGILALSCLLKNTIIQKADYITIKSELENVGNYMLIQKLRYGDSFKLVMEVTEPILRCKTLKFILQPIVENAIIHGIRNENSLLTITIRLRESQDDIVFEVSDDGKGFDIEEVERIEQKDIKLSGIGIHNVKDRIRLHFGEKYSVNIESEIGKGTLVTLHIPKMEE